LTKPPSNSKIKVAKSISKDKQMGEMKVVYSDKKVIPFCGMKLLKDFMD